MDATNAVTPVVSVITPIGYDHQAWLGETLEAIAGEKAGIIKAHVPVVSTAQDAAAEKVIRTRATECDAPLQFVTEPYAGASLALAGTHQKHNAALAVAALRSARIDVDNEAIVRGLTSVRWPARFQLWDERTVVDGAHNPSGAEVLAKTWRQQFGNQRATIILAVLSDKDIAGILGELAPIANELILPKIQSARAVDPADLAEVVSSSTPKLRYSISSSVDAALESARNTGPTSYTRSKTPTMACL